MAPAWTIALAVLAWNSEPTPRDPRPESASPRTPTVGGGGSPASPRTPTSDRIGGDAPGSPRMPTSTRIGVAILRADGFGELGELERAISLRLPGLTLIPLGEPAPPAEAGSLRAFIELEHVDTRVRLSLILADGRGYLREVEVEADAAVRPAAGALANLIAAIEDDTVAPDERDVPLPAALVSAPEPTKPVPKDIPEPTPVVAAPPTPTPVRWALGPLLRIGGGLGLSPPPGPRGVGAALGLDVRAPSRLLLALDLQWLTRAVDRYHLQRVRVALGVGYALRRGGFELPVAVMVAVEPWWLGDRGTRVPIATPNGHPPAPLLGLGLRVSPGYSAAIGKQGARLRVGARVELWGSGQPGRGLHRPELHLAGRPVGIGGAELQLGLEIGVWLPVGRGVHRSQRTGP